MLGLLRSGLDSNGIAGRLGISRHTVRDHLKNLFRKTRTRSRNQLMTLYSSGTTAPPVG